MAYKSSGNHREKKTDTQKIRYAVVGLGYISQSAMLPAFRHASENSKLTALVSDNLQKLKKLGKRYRVATENCYVYDTFDEMLSSGNVDAVYIALPNSMHRDYTIRAAQAGIHVLCEKPMALTSQDCMQMIEAAEGNDVRLMIAYRLHFEKANLLAIKTARSGVLGDSRFFNSTFSMMVREGDIRLQGQLGGGTLYDIGIYCINAARHLFGEEPVAVSAMSGNSEVDRFLEVDESTSASLIFSNGRMANFVSSFGSADTAHFQLVGTRGQLSLEKAYEIAEPMKLSVKIKNRTTSKTFPVRDQFAPELIHFSDCILKKSKPTPSGEEGLADVRIIEALYQSARTGQVVPLERNMHGQEKPVKLLPSQEITKPAVKKQSLVHARRPSEAASD